MATLAVNLGAVVAARDQGGQVEPDPVEAAVLAERAGADGVVARLIRPSRASHERDLYMLKGVCKTRLTLQLAPIDELVQRALNVKPWMAIIETEQAESTGLGASISLASSDLDFGDLVSRFDAAGVAVCFNVEPEPEAVKQAAKANAPAVLINSSGYVAARTMEQAQQELDRIDTAVVAANKAGLTVYCGHGLTARNIRPLAELEAIDEFVVGHALFARAISVGYDRAVRDLLAEIRIHRPVA